MKNKIKINKDEVKSKAGAYLTNFLTPSAIGALQDLPGKAGEFVNGFPGLERISEAANPIGALIYGGLDIASEFSDKLKYSIFNRLIKLGGLGIYGAQVVKDVLDIGRGYYPAFADLLFDGLMAYQLGKDSLENYTLGKDNKKADFLDDVKFWKWNFSKDSDKK